MGEDVTGDFVGLEDGEIEGILDGLCRRERNVSINEYNERCSKNCLQRPLTFVGDSGELVGGFEGDADGLFLLPTIDIAMQRGSD